jgi:glycosyltransferase involved in cell wall biosynthesis
MKILQVCSKSPYPPLDGGSVAMLSHTMAFRKCRHQVTVLTMTTQKHSLSNHDKQEFDKIAEVIAVPVNTSVKFHRILMNLFFADLPYNAERFITPRFRKTLIRLLRSVPFDIIQLEGLYLTPYIPDIRKNSNALVAFRAHNVEHEIWQRIARNETRPIAKYYYKILANRILRLEHRVMNSYDLLVPITQRDQLNFDKLGNTRPVFVCPAGLVLDPLPENAQVKPVASLFFLGALDWKPNQEGLLWFVNNVFPDLQSRFPGIQFHVAGRNAPAWLVKILIRCQGITFHSEVPDARTFVLSKGILVAPYFSGGGMRVKIPEAMALGKPVVTSSLGAEGLDVSDGNNIFIAGKKEEYIEKIEKLLLNPDLFVKIGANALAFIRSTFNERMTSERLVEFYENQLK